MSGASAERASLLRGVSASRLAPSAGARRLPQEQEAPLLFIGLLLWGKRSIAPRREKVLPVGRRMQWEPSLRLVLIPASHDRQRGRGASAVLSRRADLRLGSQALRTR